MYAITTNGAPEAIGPYSQGALAARFVFASGQIGIDPATGELVPGGVAAQAERALTNAEAIVKEGGCTMEDVVKTTVFLAHIEDFAAVNEVYARHFPKPAPARSCVAVAALPKGALVEVECTAVR